MAFPPQCRRKQKQRKEALRTDAELRREIGQSGERTAGLRDMFMTPGEPYARGTNLQHTQNGECAGQT
jgi:hypothetical protein